MQSKNIFTKIAIAAVMLLPMSVLAQSSSIQAFSPYTFFGLGDLTTPGTAYQRSMGGAGVASRSPMFINYLNPASNSAVYPQSFIFNFGLEGANFYDKTQTAKTSFNTFNVRDVAIRFPIAKKLGFGFSMTPYSNVGYRVESRETDREIIASLGDVVYQYQGEGNITQFKAGVGMEIFKNFSVGAELIYYLGTIDRSYNTLITPITQTGSYNNMSGSDSEFTSRINAGFGLQYSPILNDKRILTIGATHTLKNKLNSKWDRYIHSNNIFGDTVSYKSKYENLRTPGTTVIGATYMDNKWMFALDYQYQGWGNANKGIYENSVSGQVKYVNTNTVKFGLEYTPNRVDVRKYFRRISYRAGFRYADSYMQFNGQNMSDKAVTLGAGLPVKIFGKTYVNVGLEFGERGTTKSKLIKEKYFKFSLGLSLFGEDYWFMKQKYD